MRIEASNDVYVYVINADDAGRSYRLFPLPDRSTGQSPRAGESAPAA